MQLRSLLASVIVALSSLTNTHTQAQTPKPNEVGNIPVIMYHSIGGGKHDKRGLNISSETFRHQLDMMYEAGWYPMNMRDVVSARMNVPAGKTPVVLTFDDGRVSQFRYLKNGQIDLGCAIGVLETFHRIHPDWPQRATFYVNADSKYNPPPFGQRGKQGAKLQFLAQNGYEVANHSYSHKFMSKMDIPTIKWELAETVKYVRKYAPSATMDTFALPYGATPRSHAGWDAMIKGEEGGVSYENRCILLAGGNPAYPPTSKRYDKHRIMRISAQPGYVETWIRDLRAHRVCSPFISDGDPNVVTVPRSQLPRVAQNRLEGARLVVYDDGGAKPKAPVNQPKPKRK